MSIFKRLVSAVCCLSLLLAAGCNTPANEEESKGPYPVIVIPGIMGSELRGVETLYWPPDVEDVDASNMLTLVANFMALGLDENAASTTTMNPVRFSPMTEYTDGDNVGTYGTYTDLAVALSEELGYENVWFFGYDWRLDNRLTAVELAAYIDTVLSTTGAEKVNIVAHSMGGLVTSSYLSVYGDEGKSKLDRVITCGTPFLGSQGAHNTLESGGGISDQISGFDQLAPVFLQIFATIPTIYQLLPPESWSSMALVDASGVLKSDATAAQKQGHEFYTQITSNMEAIWQNVDHINVVGKTHDTAGVNGNEDGDGTVTRYSATVDGKFTSGSHTLVEMELNHNDLVGNDDAIAYIVDSLDAASYGK